MHCIFLGISNFQKIRKQQGRLQKRSKEVNRFGKKLYE